MDAWVDTASCDTGTTVAGQDTWVDTASCGGGISVVGGLLITMEALTVTGTNTFAPLMHMWDGVLFMLMVNGITLTPVDADNPYTVTVSGNAITWNSLIWAVTPADTVTAVYSYESGT